MNSWGSYPSVFAMGHRAIKDLLNHDVNVEEKLDGSQFSFGLVPANYDENTNVVVDAVHSQVDGIQYALKVRSKGAVMAIDAPEALFREACETVQRLAPELHLGWTYRGEVLKKPKHNALAYDRVPNGNIIIFDINTGDQEYLSYEDKKAEAARLGLEVVPLLYQGRVGSVEEFRKFLDTTSTLGGQKIEGVVIKPRNYDLFGLDKKVLMGKFVSEAFKEVHRKAWGESNPGGKDIIGFIGDAYRSPARWDKAILHLRERGLIQDAPQDIGIIIKEIPEDIKKEEEEAIKNMLFSWAWPHIRRAVVKGFPEHYKEQLLKLQFEKDDSTGGLAASPGLEGCSTSAQATETALVEREH